MVHSHRVRGGVVNLAPMTLGSSSMVGGWGTSGLHGRLHTFVKRALLQQLVSPGAVVCDLFCGRGTDTANWAQAGIGKYIGIDLSASALEEAKEQWEKHGQPFPATFQELDPCTGNLEILQDAGLPVDVVTCFAHLQDYFASEGMVRLLLGNIASLLKPGGYFFGTTPDSSTIWYKYQKAVEEAMKVGSLRVNGTLPRVRNPLYTITFEDDRFQFFGSKYQLRFVDGLPAQVQQLVHFPSFIRLAEEVGLEYIEIQNLTEFYDDYRVPFASTLQSSCKNLLDQKGQPMVDSRGKLSAVATDVLSLYSTFIFKKSNRIMHPTTSLDFQFHTEFQLGTDLEDSTLKSDSSPEISHGYELTPETNSQGSLPRTKRRVLSLSNGEESPQVDLMNTVRSKEEFLDQHGVNDSTSSPTVRIESSPQQGTDTANPDEISSHLHGNPPSDLNHQPHFQEIDHSTENKSSDFEDRDNRERSASTTLRDDHEAYEQFLEVQAEQDKETMVALVGKEQNDHMDDEVVHDEKLPIEPEEVASPVRTIPRRDRARSRKARFCRSASTTIDPEVTGQTCSVNYQSEVELEPIDQELDNSVQAPPILFYRRKRRQEAGLEIIAQEASFSNYSGRMRSLRPRRSSSVGDPKLAPVSATVKAALSYKVKSRVESLIVTDEKSGDFNSHGSQAGASGRSKARATLKDSQSEASHDVGQERRSTRSCSIAQAGCGDNSRLPPGATSESRAMTTRMTRMRSTRNSL